MPLGSHKRIKTVQLRILEILDPIGWRHPDKASGELPKKGSVLPLMRPGNKSLANIAFLVADDEAALDSPKRKAGSST